LRSSGRNQDRLGEQGVRAFLAYVFVELFAPCRANVTLGNLVCAGLKTGGEVEIVAQMKKGLATEVGDKTLSP